MKASIKTIVLLSAFLILPLLISSLKAQPPRPPHQPPPGGEPIGGNAPVGGGTEILLLFAAAYAYKKHKSVK